MLLFLKNMSPQKQTKKVFKSIRDVASAFNNVSFHGYRLQFQRLRNLINKTRFLSLYLLNFHLCHATVGFLNVFPHFSL